MLASNAQSAVQPKRKGAMPSKTALASRRNKGENFGRASIMQLIYCSSGLVAAPHHDTEWLQRLQLEGMAMLS
jgi:hypothetical protein